ncbi:MAG: GNAT family N-acetyltransferase [Candidatus Dormibacteria bacterium]
MAIRLESPRLIIRTLQADDQEPWLAMFADPAVRRFLPGSAPTPQNFATTLVARHEMEEELGYALWAVDDKSTGDFVGQCGLRPARTMDPTAGSEIDLAYHFTSNTWNRGYTTEAVMAVLTYALGDDGPRLERVMAVTMPENVGSWRVMEKAGMRYEGRANYYGLSGLKKYSAERAWWTPGLSSAKKE